jgi:tetratricopeptide (TPR) repeat protein
LKLFFPLIIKRSVHLIVFLHLTLSVSACSTLSQTEEDIRSGKILYPFSEKTDYIGRDRPGNKFVVRSTVGNAEYEIEIPDAAHNYDIVVPLTNLQTSSGAGSSVAEDSAIPSSSTDREFIAQFPPLEGKTPEETALLDSAFGVGKAQGPTQGPSYTRKLAKITGLYKSRQHEFALIEINNLLAYYPNSPRLYKMKGTILVKLRHFELALSAWERALELEPSDNRLKKGIESLSIKMGASQKRARATDSALNSSPSRAVNTEPIGAQENVSNASNGTNGVIKNAVQNDDDLNFNYDKD